MTDQLKKARQRVVELANPHLRPLDDGLYYYWADKGGCWAAHHLRWIAAELDRRNEPMQKEIAKYFEENPV